MGLEIFKLYGSIFVNSEKADESIAKTGEKAEGLGQKLLNGAKTAGKFGLGLATAATAGATAMYGMATKAAGVTDNVDKMSQKIGISRQAYQELEFACSQSGTSVDNLRAGVKTLTSAMDGVVSGNKTAIENFKKLGVSVTDTSGNLRSQEDVLFDTLNALQGMENQTEKSRLATELLGKSGSELMPMLNGAAGSIESMRQQAHDLGLVLDDEAIDAGVAFTDQMDQLQRSFGAVVTQVGVSVMPILSEFAGWILDHMPTIQSVISTVFSVISVLVSGVVEVFRDYLLPVLDSLWNWIEPYLPQIKDLFTEVFSIIRTLWEETLRPVFDAFIGVIEVVWGTFEEKMPQIKEFFGKMVKEVVQIWNENLKPMFDAIVQFITNVLAPAYEAVFLNLILPIVESCFNGIMELWENSLKPIFTGIVDFITGIFTLDFEKAIKGVVSIFEGVWNGLVAIAKVPINAVIGMINNLIGGLNTLKIPDWVPGLGGKGINIPMIPMLYKGTDYFQPSKVWGNMALVGEKGPELVELQKGARVHTADETQKMFGGFTLNIEQFINNRTEDIQQLAEELFFYMQQQQLAKGVK